MIDALSLAITLVSLVTGAVLAITLIGHRYRRQAYDGAIVVVQLGLVVQAALDIAALIRGHHPREPGTHLAYLISSLLVLPLAAVETRHDSGTWSAVLLLVAFIVVAVLVTRMQTTWRAG